MLSKLKKKYMQDLIIYSPIQGIGGGVDVDVFGAVEGLSKSKEFDSIYLITNRTTVQRFPKLTSISKVIITPKLIDNKNIKNFLKGRIFTILASLIIPLNSIAYLMLNSSRRSTFSILVFYNATGGAILSGLMKLLKLNLKKKCLSLTGYPSFLLKNCEGWRKKESNLIKEIWTFFTLSKFNSIFCLSSSTQSIMQNLFYKNKKLNFVFIPNPSFHHKKKITLMDLKEIYIKNLTLYQKKEDINFLCVGRFCKQKNQILALNTFKKIRETSSNINLTFIGEGEEKSYIEKLVKIYGLQSQIKLKPFSINLLSKIVNFDAIICTSLWEDSSVFLNEILSIGMPLIAPAKLHGIEDYVKIPKINDLFFDSYTDTSIEKSIFYLRENIKEVRKIFLNLSSKKLFLHSSENYSNLTVNHLL